MSGALPTASGMRKLYPSRVWCSREGMIPFSPIALQSDCRGVILTKSGLWLDLRRNGLGVKRHAGRKRKQEAMLEGVTVFPPSRWRSLPSSWPRRPAG